jgi:hypothetical protein
MAMTIRAGLDCHALIISLQQLHAGIPAQHLGVIVSAVCSNGTLNYGSHDAACHKFPREIFRPGRMLTGMLPSPLWTELIKWLSS